MIRHNGSLIISADDICDDCINAGGCSYLADLDSTGMESAIIHACAGYKEGDT